MPTTISRAEVDRILTHIPGGIVREHTLSGTPRMIADQIAAYQQAGLRDVVLWNITPFADPSLSAYSFEAMAEVRRLLGEDEAGGGGSPDA
jgi:phthiodiolone/phenolphthiodiolone dimycocerosates ketoreductase